MIPFLFVPFRYRPLPWLLSTLALSVINSSTKWLCSVLRWVSQGQNQGVGSATFSLGTLGKTPPQTPQAVVTIQCHSTGAELLIWLLALGGTEGFLRSSSCWCFHLQTSNGGVQASSYFKCPFPASTAFSFCRSCPLSLGTENPALF